MKRMLLTIGALAALSLSVRLAGGSRRTTRRSQRATVAISGSELGRVLVDGRGRTLYLFERTSTARAPAPVPCADRMAAADRIGQAARVGRSKASLLGTTKRADGRLQVTYNHHPLYTFIKDTREGPDGRENLDAFGAEWYAVSPDGAKVEQNAAKRTAASDPAPTGYGY